ncbi:unnamed protein product [Heterosigma akashiwo]
MIMDGFLSCLFSFFIFSLNKPVKWEAGGAAALSYVRTAGTEVFPLIFFLSHFCCPTIGNWRLWEELLLHSLLCCIMLLMIFFLWCCCCCTFSGGILQLFYYY